MPPSRPWHTALAALDAPDPPPPAEPSPDDMAPWRDRIDRLDEALIALLNERARCAAEIGHLKRLLGLPVYVPEREEEVLRHVLATNAGPLPPEAARRLFERIIDETRSLERRLTASDSPGPGTPDGPFSVDPAPPSPA